ncbi:hypothetical protein BJP40_00680 [Streptomyces sp. CC53]|uniref:hypothetical protein n=1 Tax=Streptomyces sp. CC53 TaxID=1906740 RepID=UPI0008DE2FC9|nr:hypothetical protein [Streptomyces sp. CC53]OII60110.1 hypothetical protein BJP40_00680 [Streptomyces sp. CC53]
MADLTATSVPIATGLADVAGAAVAASSGGDTAPVGPGRLLYVANGDASPHTVTVATPGTVKGHAIADAVVPVAAGDHALIPLANVYRGSNGRAAITYDAVTSVTVAVLEIET